MQRLFLPSLPHGAGWLRMGMEARQQRVQDAEEQNHQTDPVKNRYP
jgi:hypothetical protein